jgi:hypothetical protein
VNSATESEAYETGPDEAHVMVPLVPQMLYLGRLLGSTSQMGSEKVGHGCVIGIGCGIGCPPQYLHLPQCGHVAGCSTGCGTTVNSGTVVVVGTYMRASWVLSSRLEAMRRGALLGSKSAQRPS